MLAVTAGAFLLLPGWRRRLSCFSSRAFIFLRADWEKHVLASSGYLELGMFDDAAMALEEIAPEDKTRNEVLGARVSIYMAAKKWDMAAAVASHLVKVEPENAAGGSVSPMQSDAPKVLRRRKPFCSGRKRYIPRLP